MSERTLDLPFSPDVARSLQLGDVVWLNGEIVARAGFPTHQRIIAAIEAIPVARPPAAEMEERPARASGVHAREEISAGGMNVIHRCAAGPGGALWRE